MNPLRILAPAKLNLFLHVTGKRTDGYHLLESLVAFTDFGDVLEIKPAETLTLQITGPFAGSLQHDEDNIIMKAARLLKAHTGYKGGAHIALEKNIPVGAGLGGGSSDAATTLSALKKLWHIDINDTVLQKIALQLGSDVPVCLARQTAWMQGIGERITPIDMRADVWLVLVNPGIPVSTKEVFQRFSEAFSLPTDAPGNIRSIDELIRLIAPKHNALEAAAMTIAPVIGEVLAAINATQGCLLSRMSGSGATCFALYDNAAAAQQAATQIKRRYPGWWSLVTATISSSAFQQTQ